jgi:hypothetical protein
MNPITALFDPIEKLITEHGSAVIQEKHIALLREQIAILKEKFSTVTSENEDLKHQKQDMEKQINELTEAIAKYKSINRCPRCHTADAFQLIQRVPHFNKLLASGGATLRLYRCNKCNYEETRL